MKIVSFLKRPVFYAPAALVLAIILAFIFRGDGQVAQTFVEVKRGEVVQEVDVTGRVKSANSVDLAFERGGKIKSINVIEGQQVSEGQVLISLDNSDLIAQLNEAEANVDVQLAKLDELKKGTRAETLQISQEKLFSAQKAVADATRDSIDKLQDAYIKSDDAVRNKVDATFTGPRTIYPKFNYQFSNSATDQQLKEDIEFGRRQVEDILVAWQAVLFSLSASSNMDGYFKSADRDLDQIKSFLDKVSLAVNQQTPTSQISAAVQATIKTDVFAGRSNVSAAATNLTAAEDKLQSAKTNLNIAQQEFALSKSGTAPEAIAAQEAAVRQARARGDSIRAQIEKNIIRSPISGAVAKIDAAVGEIASANARLISVISGNRFEIETNIAEADISRVKVGDLAEVTFDAYGPDISYQVKVIKTDLAATALEGVATYKTTLQFLREDAKILEGLTANVDILTGRRENVLYVPTRDIVAKDGRKLVQLVKNEKNNVIEEIEVETGLRGSDGRTEIISGLKEGDKIVSE